MTGFVQTGTPSAGHASGLPVCLTPERSARASVASVGGDSETAVPSVSPSDGEGASGTAWKVLHWARRHDDFPWWTVCGTWWQHRLANGEATAVDPDDVTCPACQAWLADQGEIELPVHLGVDDLIACRPTDRITLSSNDPADVTCPDCLALLGKPGGTQVQYPRTTELQSPCDGGEGPGGARG